MAVPTSGVAAVVALRRADGAEMSRTERDAMLADVRGNAASTARLTMTIRAYLQGAPGAHPNGHSVRVRDGGLRALARSYRGAPFLRDHNERDLGARGGTVLASDLEDYGDGLKAIVQDVELTKPWAIEAVLDGTIDRFSASFELAGAATCTICNKAYQPSWFGLAPVCEHEPGATYQNKAGEQQLCEVEFENARGRETSGVSVPAVQGTGVAGIQAALAAGNDPTQLIARLASELGVEPSALASGLGVKETRMKTFATILAALALGADADESSAVAEIQRRDALLKAETDRASGLQTEVTALRVDAFARRKTELLERAKREGKLIPGSELETKLSALADTAIDVAEALVKDLPRLSPVGAALQSTGADPTPQNKDGAATAANLTPNQLKFAKQLGVTPEAYAEQLNKKQGGR